VRTRVDVKIAPAKEVGHIYRSAEFYDKRKPQATLRKYCAIARAFPSCEPRKFLIIFLILRTSQIGLVQHFAVENEHHAVSSGRSSCVSAWWGGALLRSLWTTLRVFLDFVRFVAARDVRREHRGMSSRRK
jgi:hypothetical protein